MASHGIKDRVAIVGMGCTPFGEHWNKGTDDLLLIGIQLPSSPQGLQLILLTLASAFPLSLTGGWFGSQLFPPVVKRRARGLGPAAL